MTFSEAIKVLDGEFYNLPLHVARMNRTTQHFFGHGITFPSIHETIPPALRTGLVKCRVVYGKRIESVEFTPYKFRRIGNVAVVHDDTIEYHYKSTDRSRLNALLEASGCDDIIIVKRGFVTDSSFANIVLETRSGALYTPATCLLRGTKRASLLEQGIIEEREIRETDLKTAHKIHLINAMLDLEESVVNYFNL